MGLLVRSRIPHRPRGEQGRPLVHRSRRRHRRGRHGDQLCARRDSCGDRHTERRRPIPDDRGQRHDLRDARGHRCGRRCDTTTADELRPVATGFGCEDDDGHFGCDQFGPDRGSIDEHTESGDGGDHRDRQRFRCRPEYVDLFGAALRRGCSGQGHGVDRSKHRGVHLPAVDRSSVGRPIDIGARLRHVHGQCV